MTDGPGSGSTPARPIRAYLTAFFRNRGESLDVIATLLPHAVSRIFSYRSCLGLILSLFAAGLGRADSSVGRQLFAHSFRAVPATAAEAPAATRHAHLLRAQLRAEELAAPITFEVALRMPNFAELQTRLAQGQLIPPAEMAARYYPSASDYQAVVDWVRGQGLEVTRTDANRLAVFGRGPVSAVAAAFQVSFGRVAADDAEYTAALTPPSLPAAIAAPVIGIHGLQPHLRLRLHRLARTARPAAGGGNSNEYTPAQILAHYNASGLNLNGSGQTIAIFSAAFASSSDLQGFWSTIGLATPPTIQQITVGAGPSADSSASDLQGDEEEATLDEEWAGALAPGATIRVYGANDQDPNFTDEIFQQIAADIPSVPSMHVLSMSYGFDETELDYDYVMIVSQYCANLASAGISILNASGDEGSNQGGKLQVSVPTSDPNVTGVGGTTYTQSGETGWSESGGGISAVFSRPSWQAGTGVPAGTMRLCPDVAAAANPIDGGLVFYQGESTQVGGTSWATPIWAAFCAMIDQYRASQGQGPIGNLNTRIYALIGTQDFFDITVGSNGAYSCGIGYDMVTGVGTPNMQSLYNASLTPPAAPIIYSQLGNSEVTPGQPATFYVVATGAATLAYQWQREAAGASTWTNLGDSGTYQGSATQMLRVLNTGAAGALNGDEFQCVVTNGQGSATSAPAELIVNQYGVSTLAGWPGAWANVDGTGFAARFESPGAIRGDGAGNYYVADGGANTVRKVTAAGVVTTVAGQAGTAGSTNGPVAVATLNAPSGVAVGPSGGLYIADDGDQAIRLVANGVVSTFATGFTDPQDVACDGQGNLYVADGDGNTVKEVSPTGSVTVLAGSGSRGFVNGTGTAASFDYPVGVALDSHGNVYVADNKNGAVREIAIASGVVTTVATGLNSPTGVSVDTAGNIYVADQGDETIRLIAPDGTVSLLAGQPNVAKTADGTPTSACFADPTQVYWDPGSGILYIAESNTFESAGANEGNNYGGTIRTLVADVPSAPQITAQPVAQTIGAGGSAAFSVAASGSGSLLYQWQVEAAGGSSWSDLTDGGSYAGSATATLTISDAPVSLTGDSYRCEVSNPNGTAVSSAATLTVQGAPVVQAAAATDDINPGGNLTLNADAAGAGPLSYQWSLNGSAIAGATGATYTISNYNASGDAGAYAVTVSNGFGSTTATIATVETATARLINLSARAVTAPGAAVLSAGVSIGGSGAKNLLLRGPGPTLADFGVPDPLPDPLLTLYNSGQVALASNQGWDDNSALAADFAATGAFAYAFPADAAMVQNLAAGQYTMTVGGASGDSGSAMAEVYDMDSISATARLINISCRANVSSTSQLFAGFTVGGTGTETVLIRGVGPTLSNFGISNPLAHPVLTVYDSSQQALQTNEGWGGSTALANTFSTVGAFALPADSADSAILITLPAGNATYTAEVTSGDGTSGVALIEIYEAP